MVPSSAPSYFSPHADLGDVFTLLITGEGLADRRAITDSQQAWGWERHKHPPLSPECDGSVQLSQGSFCWQNPRDQREILKTREKLAASPLTGGMCLRSQGGELGASPKCHSKQSGIWTGHKH